ncbi:MAG: hypothetical protein QXG39_07200 [Candidatus Aenigmatarchaeota archaeon]
MVEMYHGKLGMKDYFREKYLIRDNPFSIAPSPREIFWADRKKVFEEIKNAIETSISTSPSRIIVNWGLWGGGKTHAMVYFTSDVFKEEIRKIYGPEIDFIQVGLRLPRPTETGKIADLLYYEIINAITPEVIRQAVTRINKYIQEKENVDAFKAAEKLRAYFSTLTKRREYANVLTRLIQGIRPSERKFIYREKLSPKEIRDLGLTREIESISDMLDFLGLVTDVLTQPFEDLPEMMSELFIWIDENEAIRDLSARDVFIYRSFLRDLIDYIPREVTVFLNFSLSVGEDYSTIEAQLGDAVISRVDRDIYFDVMKTLGECLEYVRGLMEHVRIGKVDDPYHPFTEDAVKYMISQQIEKGTLPRDLNRIFGRALEIGYLKGAKRIDEKFIIDNRELIFSKTYLSQSVKS